MMTLMRTYQKILSSLIQIKNKIYQNHNQYLELKGLAPDNNKTINYCKFIQLKIKFS